MTVPKLLYRFSFIILALAWTIYRWLPEAYAETADTVIHSFNGGAGDGQHPQDSLTFDGSMFYGMTAGGGTNNAGTVFSISTNGAAIQILHAFSFALNDGYQPQGSLTLAGSTLYGMANGGSSRQGVVFSISTNGSDFQILHNFTGTASDGGTPYLGSSLTIVDSTLYGMTGFGGTAQDGTIFAIGTDGNNFHLLHSFTGNPDDGGIGAGTLTVIDSTLYGMTKAGGSNANGVVFSIGTDGNNFKLLHSFTDPIEGTAAPSSLAVYNSVLYGATQGRGNSADEGTVFSVNPDGSGFNELHVFTGASPDISIPVGTPVIVGSTLYIMTEAGANQGAIVAVSTNGTGYQVVHSFTGFANPTDGSVPLGSLTLVNSNLFGMTTYGGESSDGTIFSLPLAGGSSSSGNSLSLSFNAEVQTCKIKTTINKHLMTTNSVTNCTVSVNLFVSNSGTNTSPAFTALLWQDQGDTFNSGQEPKPLLEKIKSLKEHKSATIKLKSKFTASESGTFYYLTDLNSNVLASAPIE